MSFHFSVSNMQKRKWPSLHLVAVVFSAFFVYSVNGDGVRTCAVLYSEPKSRGITFPLKDEDIYGDVANDERIYGRGWSVTGSVEVENGCKLEVCQSTYFDDDPCYSFDEGSHSVNENYFLDNIASAMCTCEKNCSCADVHVERTACGRAYLNKGCTHCNAVYVLLNQGDWFRFPEVTMKVKTIRLRKGCTFTYYNQSNPIVITDEIVKNFRGDIGVYGCHCVDEPNEPTRKLPRPSEYPEFVTIPNTMYEIETLWENDTYRHHPGINAALRSYQKGRSSKNAYILVLGTAGAGKSTAIRLLVDNNTVTIVDRHQSPREGITEIRVPVPIDNLGVANSQLRVIDTTGLDGHAGSGLDAQVMATLDDFLMNHEELSYRIPNVVLIFHQFPDNVIEYERSWFKRMLGRYRKLERPITDETYSNVVFVLTRLTGYSPDTARQPGERIALFKRLIEEYSDFPRPIHIVTSDINGNLFFYINGHLLLPTKELYPRNLFEKFELITERAGDEIGRGVFWNAFRNSAVLTVAQKTIHPILTGWDRWGKYFDLIRDPFSYDKPENISVDVSKLVARIDKLEEELAEERKARAQDLENFKTHLVAGQMSILTKAIKTMNKRDCEQIGD